MSVSEASVLHWEKGLTEPPAAFWPSIIGFLGYDPVHTGTKLTERMQAFRRREGLSIKGAAERLGVDEGSWAAWERTGVVAWERYRAMLEKFLGASSAERIVQQ